MTTIKTPIKREYVTADEDLAPSDAYEGIESEGCRLLAANMIVLQMATTLTTIADEAITQIKAHTNFTDGEADMFADCIAQRVNAAIVVLLGK
jgi:hypothetical protein